MPSNTLAGLLCSSGSRLFLTGLTGTCTSDWGLGRSTLRALAAVPGRSDMVTPSISPSSAVFLAFCSLFSFSRASMAWSLSWSVSSSSSSSSEAGSGWLSDIGRRLLGEGDTDVRWCRDSSRLRVEGDINLASWGDFGGQFGASFAAVTALAAIVNNAQVD